MKERLLNRPQTAKPSQMPQNRPSSSYSRISFDLRPKSAFPVPRASKRRFGKTSATGRPRSGKSTAFTVTGSDVPSSAANSRPTSGYTSRATSARTRDGVSSRRTTLTSTIREGGRSPTPNAIRDMEPAFFEVQLSSPGMTIWRIQGSSLRTIEDDEIGFFHEGNAYLILNVNDAGDKSLHFWMGQFCTEKEKMCVEEKAHELDRILSFAHIFSREVQSYESYNFLRHFPDGIVYTEGKHKENLSVSAVYDKRLYIVSGRKYPRACCVYPKKEYLQTENALILDGHPRIYVWTARKCSYIVRVKAIRIAQRLLRMQRKGKSHVIVIDEDDVARHDVFAKKLESIMNSLLPPNHVTVDTVINGRLGNETAVNNGNEASGNGHHVVLHRLSGDRVLYDMPEASRRPLHHRYLVKKDSYLLDRGPDKTLYVWAGSNAGEGDIMKGLDRGKKFSEHKEYSTIRTICRIREYYEPLEFRHCFCDWRDKSARETALTKTYTIGNVERALFSNTDKRTIATLKECWSDEALEQEEGSTQVWVLHNESLVSWHHQGVFDSDKCYIVLYSTVNTQSPVHLLYYWMGSKSSKEDNERIVQFAVEKSSKLYNNTVMVRVLDGKEPQHFMAVLNNWIMVYESDASSPQQSTQMFCIRGVNLNGVRIQQVEPCWASLNSSASSVIITPTSVYLWYGKDSGCMERESTKELLALICSNRMFTYDIVAEGKEPLGFYEMFGEKTTYKTGFPPKPYERRHPLLILCSCKKTGIDFTEIEDFAQETNVKFLIEDFSGTIKARSIKFGNQDNNDDIGLSQDLSEEDVLLLDLFDEIFVWCGENVDTETRKTLPDIARNYMLLDPAGRNQEDILLLFVSQGNEPTFFTKFFKNWDSFGYSGSQFYELARKRIRQENARIDISESLIDSGYVNKPKYPYSVLLKREVPEDVDDKHKEHHLSEKQFRTNLLVSRQEFYHFPLWKQRQILRSAKLLYSSPLTLHTLDLPES